MFCNLSAALGHEMSVILGSGIIYDNGALFKCHAFSIIPSKDI